MECACLECGDTSHFREDCPVCLRKLRNINKTEKEAKMETMAIRRVWMVGNGKNKGKGENSGAKVRFPGIEDGGPRNAVISMGQTDAVSEKMVWISPIGKFYAQRQFGANRNAVRNHGPKRQLMKIVLVLLIPVLTEARCAVLTGRIDTKISRWLFSANTENA